MNSLIRNCPPDGMHRLALPLSVKESSFCSAFLSVSQILSILRRSTVVCPRFNTHFLKLSCRVLFISLSSENIIFVRCLTFWGVGQLFIGLLLSFVKNKLILSWCWSSKPGLSKNYHFSSTPEFFLYYWYKHFLFSNTISQSVEFSFQETQSPLQN